MPTRAVTMTRDLDAERWRQFCQWAHLATDEDGAVLLLVCLAESVDELDGITRHERAGLRGEHSNPIAPKVARISAIWDANQSKPVAPAVALDGIDAVRPAPAMIGDVEGDLEPWQPIATYPNVGVPPWVEVRTADGAVIHGAHYATSDGQGEQPAFATWFIKCGPHNYRAIETPTHYRYR
jgi:hypothetical protein